MKRNNIRKDINQVFLHKKSFDVFGAISKGENYSLAIAKKADVNYSHGVHLLDCLEGFGLISSEKVGRRRVRTLTEKGNKLQVALIQLGLMFKETQSGN